MEEFLFVRVVTINDFPTNIDYYVEVMVGDLTASTLLFISPEWNQVFAFEKDKITHESVKFNIDDVPTRVPPESSTLALQWYKQEGPNGRLVIREIMLCLWMGTQEDESFPNAWCSNSTMVSGDDVVYTRSKVYMSPTLWYLRINVIQAQGLELELVRESDFFVQVDLGSQHLRTKLSKSPNLLWNEDLVFFAQEPFSDTLFLIVKKATPVKDVTTTLRMHCVTSNSVGDKCAGNSVKNDGHVEGDPQNLAMRRSTRACKQNMHLRVMIIEERHVVGMILSLMHPSSF
ncbi:hypothetical protein JHK82_048572 [Glycine max]|nr:hypothetical protein JHK85_049071 [Glycine max]KAG5098718.1 hypothetical protein JHK82_048572 [Glycine max]KAH1119660.1 hypothetical protein GYH30_048158 [Glycine max]KHN37056.1 hypothetical protein glysoja_009084 [Glycine soja]